MLLMIDNYDSFTYNLVQYFAELGADVVVKRNDEITLEEIEKLNPQHLVISPGPCTPNEAGVPFPPARALPTCWKRWASTSTSRRSKPRNA